MSELLLKDLSRIDYVKNNGLVLFTWGEDNNDKEMIEKLKSLQVDAVIYDRFVNSICSELSIIVNGYLMSVMAVRV